jgi:hypothetical protein
MHLSNDQYETELKDEYDSDKEYKNRWLLSIGIEGELDIPTELLERLGWRDGDVLEWFQTGPDEFLLVKIEK